MSRLKFYLVGSYVFGLTFFAVNNFNFEYFLLLDSLIMIMILNIPSILIGSIFYLVKKKLFWIFYGIVFFLICSVFIAWTVIEIYTGGDWGKIL